MKKKILLWGSLILFVSLALSQAYAQATGTIKGKVVDSISGDPIIGVNVIVDGKQIFAVTDINGNYTLQNVPEGDQKIMFQMMGYAKTENKITVKTGVQRLNISLSYKTAEEIIVTGKRISNTEASLLSKRRKAPVAQDAISAEEISKSPDSDAADAAKRVTGVTIVDGKHIFVRGLSERYSSVMFAGSSIPSPDPDKRVVPMDIFPVGLLDNLIVIKAYTPDMPGEFGGGVVQINPKDYPEERYIKLTVGSGWRIGTTNAKFYSYKGGDWDWFGVDDGTRKLPSTIKSDNLDAYNYSAGQIEKAGESLTNAYTPKTKKGELPFSFSLSYGDTYKTKHGDVGLILSGMFKESSKTTDIDLLRVNDNHLILKDLDITKSTYSTTKGALLSLAYNPSLNHKIRLTSFYTHKSDDSTSYYKGFLEDRDESGTGDSVAKIYKLQFVTTGLFFAQLSGEHYIKEAADMKIDWTGSYSLAMRDEPDTRYSQLIDMYGTGEFYVYRADDMKRSFYDHDESVIFFSPAMTFPFKQWSGLTSKVKIGGSVDYRERESTGRTFVWNNSNVLGSTATTSEPLEDLFNSSTIVGGNADADATHYYLKENSGVNNSYNADMIIGGLYAMIDIPLATKLRLVLGLRYEYADMNVYTYSTSTKKYENLKKNPLEKHNFLPGLSLTYSPTSDMNLRAAFSKTLTRPDFRECTDGKYPTMLSDEIIVGNPDLVQTDVYNTDLRYEWFPSASEIIALSFFYKYMVNPIEMLEITGSAGSATYKFQNAVYAHNLGAELEIRKDFSFIWKGLKDLSMSFNFAYIYSIISVDDYDLAEYSTKDRPLQGQSPYVVNTGLHYDNQDAGFSGSVLFNISGRRIMRVGTVYAGVKRGDVYEEPVPRLDLVLKQRVMEGAFVKLTFANLIDPEIKETQERPKAGSNSSKTYTLNKYHDGRSIGLSYSQTF